MQLRGGDVLRPWRGRGRRVGGEASAAGTRHTHAGTPTRLGLRPCTHTHTHTPAHTGHMHLRVRPSVHAARTHPSLSSHARLRTRAHTHSTRLLTCQVPPYQHAGGHGRCPCRERAPSAHASLHTRVEGHAAHTHTSLHARTSGPGPMRARVHAYTHTGCTQLHTNASQPRNVQESTGKRDANPIGL